MSSQPPVQSVETDEESQLLELTASSKGRTSGKAWKLQKTATRRSHLPDAVKTKRWEDRMQRTKREASMKQLQAELKDEKAADIKRRREITQERKKAAEEKQRLEEDKAKMGARKAARLRRKAGRTKKINH